MIDPDEMLDPLQEMVGEVIAKARAFKAAAGSPEMRAVQAALDYLGMAYAVLDFDANQNPAWA